MVHGEKKEGGEREKGGGTRVKRVMGNERKRAA
jgi:hypothetical protein